jgi:diacylglycerol kinase family enzyme
MAAAEYCIISNPVAGRSRAAGRLARLRRRWEGRAEFWPTQHAGHAEELAYQAAQSGFGTVVAAGGDGTVHEVANGLLRAAGPAVVFGVLPIGSANDYAYSLACDGRPRQPGGLAVDVGSVSDPAGRHRYFLCCLGLGFNGAVTLEAERIKRLQGLALYGLATLRALWRRYSCPVMKVTLDDQPARAAPTLMLSLLLGRREGRFEMAPQARLDDGEFEYIRSGGLSRLEILRLLPRLALSGPPRDYPKVCQGQCRQVALSSEAPLTVHIDGEFFSRPEDNVRELKVRLLPRALRVQLFAAEQ